MTPKFVRIVYLSLAEADQLMERCANTFIPSTAIDAAFKAIGAVDCVEYYIRPEDVAAYDARKLQP